MQVKRLLSAGVCAAHCLLLLEKHAGILQDTSVKKPNRIILVFFFSESQFFNTNAQLQQLLTFRSTY